MLPDFQGVMALSTAPDMETARRLAGIILQERAAACVNLVPGVESHYWWDDKIEKAAEVILVMKTRLERLGALEQCIKANHPYQTPEFISFRIDAGSRQYMQWIDVNVPKHNVPLS